MRKIIVSKNDEGQRFDKYLFKYFSNVGSSFIYKMLRKKNIVLNSRKSDGKDLIKEGDIIEIYMAEETIEKFSNKDITADFTTNNGEVHKKEADKSAFDNLKMPPVIYEDDNILLVNKPVGMLSQKAETSDVSANEVCLSYLLRKGDITDETLKSFKPSVVNRLDRNTCGILICAKTYIAANSLSAMLKDRTIHKYYKCIVKGKVEKPIKLEGFLSKDNDRNTVNVNKNSNGNDSRIVTVINPIESYNNLSLLEIELITGKTHQIRAHLASIGHPIVGDYKYGDRKLNDAYKKKYGIKAQLLCSYKLIFPEKVSKLEYLQGKIFTIDVPDIYKKVFKDGNMEIKRS